MFHLFSTFVTNICYSHFWWSIMWHQETLNDEIQAIQCVMLTIRIDGYVSWSLQLYIKLLVSVYWSLNVNARLINLTQIWNRRWSEPHCSYLWKVCPSTWYHVSSSCRSWTHWCVDENLNWACLFFHHHIRARNCLRHKKKLCYIGLDYKEELEKAKTSSVVEKNYLMGKWSPLVLSGSFLLRTKVLYQLSMILLGYAGIHETTYNFLMKCDDIRKDMYGDIVISGGTTFYLGSLTNWAKISQSGSPSRTKIKAVGPPEENFSVWIGGFILASLSTFQLVHTVPVTLSSHFSKPTKLTSYHSLANLQLH